eukprot:298772_1
MSRGVPFQYANGADEFNAVETGPSIEYHPKDNAFTVKNVYNFDEFKVDSPSLPFQVLEDAPNAYRVEYAPTGMHHVRVHVGQQEVASFNLAPKRMEHDIRQAAEAEHEMKSSAYMPTNDAALLESSYDEVEETSIEAAPVEWDAVMPRIDHHAQMKALTISPVEDISKLNIDAPELSFKLSQRGNQVRMSYADTPKGVADVRVTYDGQEVERGSFRLAPAEFEASMHEENDGKAALLESPSPGSTPNRPPRNVSLPNYR